MPDLIAATMSYSFNRFILTSTNKVKLYLETKNRILFPSSESHITFRTLSLTRYTRFNSIEWIRSVHAVFDLRTHTLCPVCLSIWLIAQFCRYINSNVGQNEPVNWYFVESSRVNFYLGDAKMTLFAPPAQLGWQSCLRACASFLFINNKLPLPTKLPDFILLIELPFDVHTYAPNTLNAWIHVRRIARTHDHRAQHQIGSLDGEEVSARARTPPRSLDYKWHKVQK